MRHIYINDPRAQALSNVFPYPPNYHQQRALLTFDITLERVRLQTIERRRVKKTHFPARRYCQSFAVPRNLKIRHLKALKRGDLKRTWCISEGAANRKSGFEW